MLTGQLVSRDQQVVNVVNLTKHNPQSGRQDINPNQDTRGVDIVVHQVSASSDAAKI